MALPVLLGIAPQKALGASTNSAQFAVSPDNGRAFLLRTLKSAQREVLINIYEFKEPTVRDTLIDLIHRGVTLKLLVEGEPVGGLSRVSKEFIEDIHTALRDAHDENSHIYVMAKQRRGVRRRFVYDHAKYMVIDQETVFVSSENFSPGAHGAPGRIGNRGWHVSLKNAALARQLIATFESDTDPSYDDILDLDRDSLPIATGVDESTAISPTRRIKTLPIGTGRITSGKLIFSPHSEPGLEETLSLAKHAAKLQFMSLPPQWKSDQRTLVQNPIVSELIATASRGAAVQVILNDDNSFGHVDPAKDKNLQTVCLLNQTAREKGFALIGRIIDRAAAGITYIHNKGILVDDTHALVSSINGSRNSVENNREAAILLESPDANAFFGRAFASDWRHSKAPSDATCRIALGTLRYQITDAPRILSQALGF